MKTMSHDKYLQMLGLLTLAQQNLRAINEIEVSARQLVGEDPDSHNSHVGDAVWDGYGHGEPGRIARDLLGKLDIEVEPPAAR